jgi:hypothetical protein
VHGDLPLNFLIEFVHQVLLPPDGALTGYVYIDLNSKDYGGFARAAYDLFRQSYCSHILHVSSRNKCQQLI